LGIAAYVSALNDCRYCSASHSACAAAQLPGGMVLVQQVRADATSAPVSAKLKTLLAIAAATQQSGLNVSAELVAQARAADATDLEIHDTVLIAAVFCMFNRYVDGRDRHFVRAALEGVFWAGRAECVPPGPVRTRPRRAR